MPEIIPENIDNTTIEEMLREIKSSIGKFNESEIELHAKCLDVLDNIEKIRQQTSEDASEQQNLGKILYCMQQALKNRTDPQQSQLYAKELANLANLVSGKSSSVWKTLGTSLLVFACAALVVAGVLLAIPSGGISLLLSAIGVAGLTSSVGIGAGIAVTGAVGAGALYHGSEKGLAKAVNSFAQSLEERELYEPLNLSSSLSSSGSNPEQEEQLPSSTLSELSITPESSSAEIQHDDYPESTRQSSNSEQVVLEGQKQKSHPSISAFASDVVYQQIIQAINTDCKAKSNASLELISNQNSKDMLVELKNNLKVCEGLMHPDPIWNYTRIEAHNKDEKDIIKIKYNPTPSDLISKDVIDSKVKHSIITRKLSIIGGILTLLDYPDYLTKDINEKDKIRARLAELSNIVINSVSNEVIPDPKIELNNFVASLGSDLEALTNSKPKNIIREIREAERYFVAEHNKNQILIVEIPRGDKTIFQMDIELNHQLTDEQKNSYLTIHNEESERPKWFQELRGAEQAWYRDKIPHPDMTASEQEQKWSDFQLLFKSSAMTHTSGLPNARINYLMQKTIDDGLEVLNTSIKSATPVCYEMPSKGQTNEQSKHNKDNAKQLIDNCKRLASANNKQLWGDFFTNTQPPKVPILVQSLLSKKIEKMGITLKADNELIEGQQAAMNNLGEEDDGFHIMYHNNGTNGFSRGNKICMQGDPDFVELVDFAKNFLKYINSELSAKQMDIQINVDDLFDNKIGKKEQQKAFNFFMNQPKVKSSFTAEQQKSITTIFKVLNEYNHYEVASNFSRNKAEYIVSLKKMLVEAMGGAVTNNCKSGKDRTGHSEVYQHAVTLTMLDDPSDELLHYDEIGTRRELFCDNLAILNASGKIQFSAHLNTNGCLGTKAPEISLIIDDDVRKNKYFSRLYKVGCSLASMNKPTAFSKDEKEKANDQQNTTDKTTDMKKGLFNIRKESEFVFGANEGRLIGFTR